ncbi:hypothetical protein ATANTOWER_013860 [Ataeniobius toweri]|uniref:Uncharacterized protein n=1 Tax=Ataeniobius toweri TaxID=208326 RepID=A0ABU7A209_9TELE|nr:hypothetical protein [Ataeniobius toweri]
MLTSKHKEAVMEVRRHLVEAATKEKLPIKMSMGRVTPEQLCSYVKLFRSNWEALESHCGVLQLGLATAQMLQHPSLARWDSCLAFERLLLQRPETPGDINPQQRPDRALGPRPRQASYTPHTYAILPGSGTDTPEEQPKRWSPSFHGGDRQATPAPLQTSASTTQIRMTTAQGETPTSSTICF